MLRIFQLPVFLLLVFAARAQDVDVQHYSFQLKLSAASDRIEATAGVQLRFIRPTTSFMLDLVQQKANGKGMKVASVSGYKVRSWKQQDDRLVVEREGPAAVGEAEFLNIQYSGVPADGLIISKNKYGERTFFADNWPNRAHHWIPCNDRPDDKASFEFFVSAPAGYQIISNGLLQADSFTNDWIERARNEGSYAHWKETIPHSTKVMVIGVARFAVKTFDDSPEGVPVSAWVYPQDSTKGFHDYALAPSIIKFFSSYVGPFPYQKLANVQSKTIFGGMENASAIFYAEESVTGDRKWEDVIAHEIAHQWFGDMASEQSFAHLWLSEGFATYLTNIYWEKKYGVETMNKRLEADRDMIRKSGLVGMRTVVDDTSNLMSLLNTNSYQKGGWVLHMLRREVGDSLFQKIIATYYSNYKGSNATTENFGGVVEQVTGKSWGWFFEQWLYRPSMPGVKIEEEMKKGKVKLTISQGAVDRHPFLFTLEVGIVDDAGQMSIHEIPVTELETKVKLEIGDRKPVKVIIDPNTNLLFRPFSGTYWKKKEQKRTTPF